MVTWKLLHLALPNFALIFLLWWSWMSSSMDDFDPIFEITEVEVRNLKIWFYCAERLEHACMVLLTVSWLCYLFYFQLLREACLRFGKDLDTLLLRALDTITEAILRKASTCKPLLFSPLNNIISGTIEESQQAGMWQFYYCKMIYISDHLILALLEFMENG